jgi:hypothetical protein
LYEFNTCPHNADAAVVSRHYEVYLYYLLGEIIFFNSSGDYVEPHLIWFTVVIHSSNLRRMKPVVHSATLRAV